MELTTVLIICGSNLLFLYLFSALILRQSSKRNKILDESLTLKIDQEEDRLEELSNDLLKVADTLLIRLEEKEKEIASLVGKVETLNEEHVNHLKEYSQAIQAPVKQTRVNRAKTTKTPSPKVRVERHEILLQSKEYLDQGSKFKEIYFLADQGKTLSHIAQKTGKSKGEVELVLSLREVRKK